VAYDPDLFRGAAAYYDRFRAPYARAAIDFAAERLGLSARSRLLDLGCGPGTLARRLSARVAEVIAMDPDPDMLAEGRRLAAAEGRANIVWTPAGSEELGQLRGPFRGVVMGQSFHWMDRDQVLRDLHPLIEDGGGLALVNPGRRRPQESWETTAEAVIDGYLGPHQRHPQRHAEPKHEPALLRSAFEITDDVEFSGTVSRDFASIIGHVYSTTRSPAHLFGDRRAAFEADLRAALRTLRPDGLFEERVETGVLIAMKR
jgi:cyclopropane fatty-acyl-phospholipid synthase-like methyltransferase